MRKLRWLDWRDLGWLVSYLHCQCEKRSDVAIQLDHYIPRLRDS